MGSQHFPTRSIHKPCSSIQLVYELDTKPLNSQALACAVGGWDPEYLAEEQHCFFAKHLHEHSHPEDVRC